MTRSYKDQLTEDLAAGKAHKRTPRDVTERAV
jgi:hypothetical protein